MKFQLDKPTEYQVKQCELFTEYVYETSEKMYKSRGSSKADKIKLDIYNGKIAECCVFNYLEGEGFKTTPPDFAIYPKKRKNFDADLVSGDMRFHIKSCMKSSKYPNSWLFQKNDPLITCNLTDDYLILCVMNDDSTGFAYSVKYNSELLSEPVVFQLRSSKVAIYEENIL